MTQPDKIYKGLKIIYKYLPSTYPKVGVKIYQTCHSMLRAEANHAGNTYRQECNWYRKYLKKHDNTKEDYIHTKYYKPKEVEYHRRKYLEFHALADNLIKINIENTKYFTLKNYIFLLLHEVGHHYYTPKGQKYNEHLCDLFAIRWIKKINRQIDIGVRK